MDFYYCKIDVHVLARIDKVGYFKTFFPVALPNLKYNVDLNDKMPNVNLVCPNQSIAMQTAKGITFISTCSDTDVIGNPVGTHSNKPTLQKNFCTPTPHR